MNTFHEFVKWQPLLHAYVRGKQYERMKKREGAPEGNQNNKVNVEKTPQLTKRTSERLAEIHKVNERTIREDEKYALSK